MEIVSFVRCVERSELSLTKERLIETLEYDPETGVFTWLVEIRTGQHRGKVNVHPGDTAGTINDAGYRIIGLFGKSYRASHLAFLWMTGSMPLNEVDHRDCDPSNDAWSNLRQATSAENKWNVRVSKNNRSGLKGAFWHKTGNCWRSQIMRNGKLTHLGLFKTAEEAHHAYAAAAKEQFGQFARTV